MVLLWQDVGFNKILTVPNCCPTVARSTSATWCASPPNRCPIYVRRMMLLRVGLSQTIARSMSTAWCRSQSGSPPNCCSIYVSRIVSFVECCPIYVSRIVSFVECCPIYVSRIMSLTEWVSAKPLPNLCQPHDVCRVRLGQTIARSMSATWCRSQSESQPNRCPIYVSRMMFAECVSAKPLPDPRQPHDVRLRQTVARSTSAAWCCSEWVSAKPLPDPCQPHDVARRVGLRQTCCSIYVSRIVSFVECCPIYVSRIMSLAEWVSAKPLPNLCQPHDVARRVSLSQTVAQSMSAAWCLQSASRPNHCPIYVNHIMSLAEWVSAKPLPDLQYAPREMDHIQNHTLNFKFSYIKSQQLITTSSRVSVIMSSSTWICLARVLIVSWFFVDERLA